MKFFILSCLFVSIYGASLDKRIVDGEDTTITEYPWQVSLIGSSGSHTCGASIIDEKWVVTAAHCVDGSLPSELQIRAGSTDRTSGGQVVKLTKIITHPGYDGSGAGFPNDIAVLELSEPLTLDGKNTKAIRMAEGSETFSGDQCDITGWGRLSGGGLLPPKLQKVTMTVLSNNECAREWTTVSGAKINDGHICIGSSQDTGKSACNGDSGGPMTCEVNNEKVLAGATSWGISGCTGTYPSVYTRITYFRDWVRKETGL